MQVDPLCTLCKRHLKSTEHLFFKYDYMAYIWSVYKLKLGLQQKPDYCMATKMTEFQKMFKKKWYQVTDSDNYTHHNIAHMA